MDAYEKQRESLKEQATIVKDIKQTTKKEVKERLHAGIQQLAERKNAAKRDPKKIKSRFSEAYLPDKRQA